MLGLFRRLTIKDHGHEEPTRLITNQRKLSRTKLVDRYARRMLIENNIQDGVDFFHMNAFNRGDAREPRPSIDADGKHSAEDDAVLRHIA